MPEKDTSPTKVKAAKINNANTKADEKQARLANALRENLRRRKDRKRGKNDGAEKKIKAR
jgi:hypothetical protein